jgi:hypothetical protein
LPEAVGGGQPAHRCFSSALLSSTSRGCIRTLRHGSKSVPRQEAVVRCCVQARAWAALVTSTGVLVLVATAGLDVDVLVGCAESRAVDWAGVSLVLGEGEVG